MQRPVISGYKDPVDYMRDVIRFRKEAEDGFTVVSATKGLRRISPALVSLILKRSLTLDRVDEFTKLLDLNAAERFYFKNWLIRLDDRRRNRTVESEPEVHARRKEVAAAFLNDWLNAYVKDFFHIPAIQKNTMLIKNLSQSMRPSRGACRIAASVTSWRRLQSIFPTAPKCVSPGTRRFCFSHRIWAMP